MIHLNTAAILRRCQNFWHSYQNSILKQLTKTKRTTGPKDPNIKNKQDRAKKTKNKQNQIRHG